MARVRTDKIEVHVFRRRAGRVEFLVLRRAPDRKTLPGVWQPVTGGMRLGEKPFAAARRELREETGLAPQQWWALEQPTPIYETGSDAVTLVPVFVAEIGPSDRVKLSAEHDAMKFAPAAAAAKLFLWNTQRDALEAVREQILRGGASADARRLAGPPSRRKA